MSGCYISPVPTRWAPVYDGRRGDYVMRRFHYFEQASGIPMQCNPAACRECYREETIHGHG